MKSQSVIDATIKLFGSWPTVGNTEPWVNSNSHPFKCSKSAGSDPLPAFAAAATRRISRAILTNGNQDSTGSHSTVAKSSPKVSGSGYQCVRQGCVSHIGGQG